LSSTRFQQVRAGQIDLHNAFSKAEDGFVFFVTLFDDSNHVSQVTTILVSHLDDAQIPDAGEFLNLESAGLEKIIP